MKVLTVFAHHGSLAGTHLREQGDVGGPIPLLSHGTQLGREF
jgi:hypothetical protein